MHAIYLTTLLGAIVAAAPPLTGPAGFAQTARVRDFPSLEASALLFWPI